MEIKELKAVIWITNPAGKKMFSYAAETSSTFRRKKDGKKELPLRRSRKQVASQVGGRVTAVVGRDLVRGLCACPRVGADVIGGVSVCTHVFLSLGIYFFF